MRAPEFESVSARRGDCAYELSGVGFRVGTRELLAGVDLQIRPGCVYGLLGHNGSGKTTLMRLLARQESATAGRIRYGGFELGEWSPRAFAREVAYLAQRLPDATGLTVRELAALGRYPWHGPMGRFGHKDGERVRTALELTGMEPLADRLVDTLSGGERQRAWIAMLVAQDSRCMLLDEPISALDVAHQMEVMDLVRFLCHERELGVVTVLHDINIAARYCDHLVALHSGRKLVHGTPDEVIRPDTLERIYGVSMGVLQPPELAAPVSYVA